MKIALGTAQFGLDYGLTNASGKVPADEVARILDAAEGAGVRTLDTAWAYGGAETILGELRATDRFDVVTKTASVEERGYVGVLDEVGQSFSRLDAMPLYGLLIHSAVDLLGEDGPMLAEMLHRFKSNGAIEHFGVSAYNEDELFAALDVLGEGADLVQVPVNVFDQRLVKSGALAELKRRGIQVHARSAFLQGLLLMEPASLPAYFEPVRDRIEAWRAYCAERGVTPLGGALGFVTGIAEVDQVVVGVESVAQLEEVLAASTPLPTADFEALALDDPAYVDPSRWQVER